MRSIHRVLVVQPYGIGDLLFMTPVLRALRLLPGIERVDLLLGSRTSAMVENNPHAGEIFCVDKDLFHRRSWFQNLREMLSLFFKLKEKKYDLMLDYSMRDEYGLMAWLLGIPKRAGFAYKKRGKFHNLRISLPAGFSGKHVTDYFCDLAEKAGVRVMDRFMEFYPSDKEKREALTVLKNGFGGEPGRYLVVSPGGGESWGKDADFKRWPMASFVEFCQKLRTRVDFDAAVVLGSAQEKNLGEDFRKAAGFPVLNLAGVVSLGAAAAILEKACLVAANDGGLVHLASVFKTPVIAFYGPVDPVVYGPFPPYAAAASVFKEGLECRPCYKSFRYNSACPKRECLTQLSPAEALDFLDKRNFFQKWASVCEKN